MRGGEGGRRVWRRFLKVDPSLTPHYLTTPLPSPLERSKLLLSLARQAQAGTYAPADGKSSYQLFVEWLEGVEANAEEVGLDWEEVEEARKAVQSSSGSEEGKENKADVASVTGKLMRIDGPMKPATSSTVLNGKQKEVVGKKQEAVYDDATDPSSEKKLDVEQIVQKDGLEVFKDQAGRLWTGLATFWIRKGEFDRVGFYLFFSVVQVFCELTACCHCTSGQVLFRDRTCHRAHYSGLHPDL